MDCEKYAKCMIDSALGQLPPSREAELIAHMSDCAACRQAFKRAKQAAELVDRGMELLVEDEPSPQFAARLHARMAEEPRIGSFWARQFPIAASVLLFVSVVAVVAMTYRKRVTDRRSEPSVASLASRAASGVNAGARPFVALRTLRPRVSRSHARVSMAGQPEVLVAPGEMAALGRFDEALQRYQAAGARLAAQHDDADQPMKLERLEVSPLEVKPIEVPTIPEFTDSSGGF